MVLNRSPGAGDGARPRQRCRSDGPAGFTLIEVLIAMIILSVGLLALQALSIAVVRSAAVAEQDTRSVLTATHFLEEALEQLRRETVPASFVCTLSNGDQVSRTVTAASDARVAVITVEVIPGPRGLQVHPYMISTHGYSPQGFRHSASAFACP